MTLTANLPRRPPSRTANWALRLAVFLPVLALFSVFAHRSGAIATPAFLTLMVLCALICATALLLVLVGVRSLWVHGARGGRKLSWALFLLLPFLLVYGWIAVVWIAQPTLSDVSTDLINPPLFSDEVQDDGATASALVAARLIDGYPALGGARFKAPLDATNTVIYQIADDLAWQPEASRGRVGADDEVTTEFVYRVPVLNLPFDIVIRASDEGETAFVDIRVRTAHLPHDLGTGARIVTRFLAELDYAMIGIAEP